MISNISDTPLRFWAATSDMVLHLKSRARENPTDFSKEEPDETRSRSIILVLLQNENRIDRILLLYPVQPPACLLQESRQTAYTEES
jgi:hypothetical protein